MKFLLLTLILLNGFSANTYASSPSNLDDINPTSTTTTSFSFVKTNEDNLNEEFIVQNYGEKLDSVFNQTFEQALENEDLWDLARYSHTIEPKFKKIIFQKILQNEKNAKHFDQCMYTLRCFYQEESWMKERHIFNKFSFVEMDNLPFSDSWTEKLFLSKMFTDIRKIENFDLQYNLILMRYSKDSDQLDTVIINLEHKTDFFFNLVQDKNKLKEEVDTFIKIYDAWYPFISKKRDRLINLREFQEKQKNKKFN